MAGKKALWALVGLVVGIVVATVVLVPLVVPKDRVTVVDYRFEPRDLTVAAGTTVTWTNRGGWSHSVTFNNPGLERGWLVPGASFSYTFLEPGWYPYHCEPHPDMVGTVRVTG